MRIHVRQLTGVGILAAVVWCPATYGQFLGDFSPDTTGVPVDVDTYSQIFPGQYLADEFTLASPSTVTGGSIFSGAGFGGLGDPARFVILPDVAGVPGAVPVVDVTTTLDVVDTMFTTSQPTLTRKHATIPATILPAGTYWFYLAGEGVDIAQATGTYDDGVIHAGFDADPDLEGGVFSVGDTFFQIEGSEDVPPVPGVSGIGLAVLILLILGTMMVMNRKRRLPGMRWLIVVLFLVGLSLPAWAPPALADIVSLAPTKDATLYSEIPTNASGSGPTLIGGVNGVGAPNRTVLAFDVAGSVPAGATIDSVELRLNYVHSNNSGTEAPGGYALHPLLADWGEGPSNAGPFPGAGFGAAAIAPDATWLNTLFPGSLWVTPGGDFAVASSAAISIPSFDCFIGSGLECGIYTWTSPAMAADVQGWLDSPASNFGWILKGADETSITGTTRGFDSREGAVPPELVINFSPVAVPGVSGWGIAVFALAMLTALTLLMFRRARA